jgi:hypothetical protein
VTPNLVLKEPYLLDFLGLNDRYLERDLEDAILREMEQFLLELGAGFIFVARQKRLQGAIQRPVPRYRFQPPRPLNSLQARRSRIP